MRPFSKVTFLLSAMSEKQFPPSHLPELAISGRSNVGKSSLINHLFQKKNLAKISSVPGKTQQINFYNVWNKFLLADPPGYGFAKVSKSIKKKWAELLTTYFESRSSLTLILFLLDLRRVPSKEDIEFFNWCLYQNKKMILIFTKTDKIKKSQKDKNIKIILKTLGVEKENPLPYIPYSIYDRKAKLRLTELIINNIGDSIDGPDQ